MGTPASVDLKSLGDRRFFVELGSGGEGRVFAIPGQKDVVYKEFLSLSATSPDTSALATLIDLRNRWSQEDRDWLDQRKSSSTVAFSKHQHFASESYPHSIAGQVRRYQPYRPLTLTWPWPWEPLNMGWPNEALECEFGAG